MYGSKHNVQDTRQLAASLIRDETASALQGVCEHLGIDAGSVAFISNDEALSPETAARAIIVEIGEEDRDRLQAVEALASKGRAGQSVIAIVDRPSGDDVRRLFRAGVSDVLSYPVERGELASALTTAFAQPSLAEKSGGQTGKLLAVLKSGGGVGATTLAVNMATEFARMNYGSVVLVDLDVQFGGIDVALDIAPRLNFSDAVRAGKRLDGTMLQSMMTPHPSGIDILPAAKSLAQVDVVTEEFAQLLCDLLKQNYDYVFIDMPTCWTSAFYPILSDADAILPVVSPTVRSADCARRIIQAIGDLGIERPTLVPVANRVGKESTTADRLKKIGEILGAKVEFSIREDSRTASQAADMGQTMRDVSSSAGITNDFSKTSAGVHSLFERRESAADRSQSRRLFSFGARS